MRVILTIALLLAFAAPALASGADPAGVFRYELRALGALAGEAVLTISEPKSVGDREVRRVRIEARTAGLAGRVYKASGHGTAIVDDQHRPMRVEWTAKPKGNLRDAKVKIGPKGVKGLYRRAGRKDEKINYDTATWPMDAVSAYIAIPQHDLTPGPRERRPFFDGRKLGTIDMTVGEAQEIHLPIGLRLAVPVHITVKRPGRSRKVVFWVGPEDRVLYRIQVEFGILNTVDADLVGMRRL